jgi:serine/threonine protein kinase
LQKRLFDRYILDKQIGEGAFGRVYLARDTRLPRRVAIKELKSRFLDDDTALRRFANDAHVAASVGHPNIVTVFDLQPSQVPRYIIMEYLPRGSLLTLLESQGRLPTDQLLTIAMDICRGLDAAHKRGVIHRDLKPANILLSDEGAAKVCDFGVAHVPPDLGGYDKSLHPHGHPGDVRYMSPEQVRGEELDARSDLYSLGAVLYQLSTGRHYFDVSHCKCLHDYTDAVLKSVPLPARQVCPAVSAELEALIVRLLSKRRDGRFNTASEVLSALRRVPLAPGEETLKIRLLSATGSFRPEGDRMRYQITIEGRNESTRALGLSGLTINVPSINSPELYEALDLQTWALGTSPPFRRGPGEMIWGFLEDGSFGQEPAESLLIESVTGTWNPGDRLSLDAALVTSCRILDAHVRVWSTRPTADGGSEGFWDPDWKDTGLRDQQGIPVYLLSLGLR